MNKIKKIFAVIISITMLAVFSSVFMTGSAAEYVIDDNISVFDLILIRRSIMNGEDIYTVDDINEMLDFLTKKGNMGFTKTVTISYDTEGADTSGYVDPSVLDSVKCYAGSKYKVENPTLIKDGCIHGGWSYDGKVYSGGDWFEVPENNVVFTPFWYVNYSITFSAGDYNDINGIKTFSASVPGGTKYDLPASSRFSRDGYRIIGWKCIQDGKTYSVGEKYIMPNQNVDFEAVWQASDVTIVLSAGNGKYSDRLTITSKCGEDFVFPECEFTNGSKTFKGWNYDGTIYQPGDVVKVPALASGLNMTIVGTWK